jgi:hypothetical protein
MEEPEPQPTKVCPTCGGLQEIWEECGKCHGDGKEPDGLLCGKCLGHGGTYKKCSTCGGKGRVPA